MKDLFTCEKLFSVLFKCRIQQYWKEHWLTYTVYDVFTRNASVVNINVILTSTASMLHTPRISFNIVSEWFSTVEMLSQEEGTTLLKIHAAMYSIITTGVPEKKYWHSIIGIITLLSQISIWICFISRLAPLLSLKEYIFYKTNKKIQTWFTTNILMAVCYLEQRLIPMLLIFILKTPRTRFNLDTEFIYSSYSKDIWFKL